MFYMKELTLCIRLNLIWLRCSGQGEHYRCKSQLERQNTRINVYILMNGLYTFKKKTNKEPQTIHVAGFRVRPSSLCGTGQPELVRMHAMSVQNRSHPADCPLALNSPGSVVQNRRSVWYFD